MTNYLIRVKLKEIVKLQDIIKNDDLNYKWKHRKTYNLGKFSLPILFSKDIHERYLSLENADHKQTHSAIELKNFEKGTKRLEKKSYLDNLGLLFSEREKVLNTFKSRLFPIKYLDKIATREPTPEPATEPEVAIESTKVTKAKTKRKMSSLKLHEEFLNKIKNEEKKNKNEQIFRE